MAKKISKGKLLTELVKGSLDYTMQLIRQAFYKQFPYGDDHDYSINEVFSDHVIVSDWRSNDLKTDEYWQVTYSKSGEDYVFAAREAWAVVELTYQPQTALTPAPLPLGEGKKKKKGQRLEESILQAVEFVETEGSNESGPWLIKGIGITADVVNANGRRYPASVLEAAVKKLKNHLHESAGQGRLLQGASLTTGESDHPKDKGNRRPLLLETVINWEDVAFDGTQVLLEGKLLATSNGKDIRAIMAGGVKPGISQRAYGDSKIVNEGKQKIEEVTDLEITGFDLTAPNEESDPYAEVTFHESQNQPGEIEMDELLKQLLKLRETNPELFGGLNESQLKAMGEQQLKSLEESLRSKLGIDASADLGKALTESMDKARQFDELQRKATVDVAIVEATKDLPFGKELNEAFTESIKDGKFNSADDVKQFAESQRKVFGKLASSNKLRGMGFNGAATMQVTGTVLENETGTPEYARGAFELAESIRRVDNKPTRDWTRQTLSLNEKYAKRVLERFDAVYERELKQESKMIEEAGTVSDLNIPYSVARAITEEAFPDLVASGIFDFDVIDISPTRLYYETFSGETGYAPSITDEVLAADHGAWVALAFQRLTPGTVVVTNSAGTTTYTEDTDYLVDYANGKVYALASGAITDAQSLKVDYTYTAIRKGEMQGVERGKVTLAYITVETKADRLADQISRESILWSQTSLSYDVRARTLANLAKQMRRKIDQGIMYMALSAAKTVANNVVGTWTAATDTELAFVKLVGLARVKVAKRYYEPTFNLFSLTNADKIANWEGFTAAGKRPDADLNANGYIGRIKGLPAFQSTEFSDGYSLVGNKQLVMHRVQKPLSFQGPLPTYDEDGKIIAAEQYYGEEFNLTESPVPGKGSLVKIV